MVRAYRDGCSLISSDAAGTQTVSKTGPAANDDVNVDDSCAASGPAACASAGRADRADERNAQPGAGGHAD